MIPRVGAAGQCRIQQAQQCCVVQAAGFRTDPKMEMCGGEGYITTSVLNSLPAASTPNPPPRGPPSHGCRVGAHGHMWPSPPIHTEAYARSPGQQACPRRLQASWGWEGLEGSPLEVHRLRN